MLSTNSLEENEILKIPCSDDYFTDHQIIGYDIYLVAIDHENNLNKVISDKILSTAKANNAPILLRCENKFKIYGNLGEGIGWAWSDLPANEVLQQLPFVNLKIVTLQQNEVNNELRDILQKVHQPKQFEKIDVKKMLETPIKVEDIQQAYIGNCFMLSALSSIINVCPSYVNKILKINADDGKVEVTFHNIHNIKQKYIYILDPTKVIIKQINHHKHDAIFLLEKAYAMHRIITEKKSYNNEELTILEFLKKNYFNIDKTLEDICTVKNIPDNNETYIKRHRLTKKISAVKEMYNKNFYTYFPALTSGSAANAFTSYLGMDGQSCIIPMDYGTNSNDIIDWILSEKELNLIFGEKSPEKELFKTITLKNLSIILQEFEKISISQPKLEVHEKLKNIFSIVFDNYYAEHIKNNVDEKALYENQLLKSIMQKLHYFIDNHIPYKRGLAIYTGTQIETYENIKKLLASDYLLTVATRQSVSKNPNNILVKGLAINHAYHIVACYEEKGLKYIIMRNPWGQSVRGYKEKKKENIGTVLSAYQMPEPEEKKPSLFSSFFQNQPSSLQINPNDYLKRKGYFKLELCDLTKRFLGYEYVQEPADMILQINICSFLRKIINIIMDKNFKGADSFVNIKHNIDFQNLMGCLTTATYNDILFTVEDRKSTHAALAIYHYSINEIDLANHHLNMVTDDNSKDIKSAFTYLQKMFIGEFPDFEKVEKRICSLSAKLKK